MKFFYKPKTTVIILTAAFVGIFTTFMYAEDEYKTFPAVFNLINLNGTNGFAISGYNLSEGIGYSVSGAGDINGDGIADILIASGNNNQRGQSYVVFGSKKEWPEEINLADLNGKNGFAIDGIKPGDQSGFSVSAAGDVNGDNIDDILIGVFGANNFIGQSYVVFGSKGVWSKVINLKNLDGSNGFSINGINPSDSSGNSVSGTGDVNGDGISDILIGASQANNQTGQSYIVFGSKQLRPAIINLADLNGNNGFTINGIKSGDQSGFSVSGAGDINKDGIADILIGAIGRNNNTGQSYVVFGRKQAWPSASFNLTDLNGKNGFAINGIQPMDASGSSISEVGDVNGDGIDDIIIGAPQAVSGTGQSYLVFGNKGPWPAAINLQSINGKNGFAIYGINPQDYSGHSVSGAGDINGDGIDDILIGAYGVNQGAGQSYVIFGNKKPWPADLYLYVLNGTDGFAINSINLQDYSGYSVCGAGDINGDGIDDILIGAPGVNQGAGQSYIIFGEHELLAQP